MITDIYHLANAAIKLNIEHLIDNEQLQLMINTLKSENIDLLGLPEITTLYDTMEAPDDTHKKESMELPIITRYNALQHIDLEHFMPDLLLRMQARLICDGRTAYEKHNTEEALTRFRDAYRIAKHVANTDGIVICLFEIGFIAHSYRDSVFAETHYREAIAPSVDIEPAIPDLIAEYIMHAGRYFELEGNADKAREYFEKTLQMFEDSHNKEGHKICRNRLRKYKK